MTKKYSQLEDAYKRDTSLFRNETIKRDEEYEEVKIRIERELQESKAKQEETVEFIR